MENQAFSVVLAGEQVGRLHRRQAFTQFRFDPDYWERPGRRVLGRWFEDHPRERPHAVNNGVPAWFANLLPEGRLLEVIARQRAVTVYQQIDILASIGRDLPGAVEVVPASITEGDEGELFFEGAKRESPTADNLFHFSLAGAALKFSMVLANDRMALPMRNQLGSWIVKTPDRNFADLPRNEFGVMQLAKAVGIDVPPTRLVRREDVEDVGESIWIPGEEVAYAVKRFDRDGAARIHIEDFAQVRGKSGVGEGKYKSNLETVAGLAFRGQSIESLAEVVRRSVFNLLVGNGDAHLKNWSLIYPDGRRAVLSPAYDLVCTAIYPQQETMGLPFFRETNALRVTREHYLELAHKLDVDTALVTGVVEQTLDHFAQAWRAGEGDHLPKVVREWIEPWSQEVMRNLSGR